MLECWAYHTVDTLFATLKGTTGPLHGRTSGLRNLHGPGRGPGRKGDPLVEATAAAASPHRLL